MRRTENRYIASITLGGICASMFILAIDKSLADPGVYNSQQPTYPVVQRPITVYGAGSNDGRGVVQQPLRPPVWNQGPVNYYGRQTNPQYPPLMLPGANATVLQSDGYGGYESFSYGSNYCGGYPATVYSAPPGTSGYVVIDEGSVQDILPVTGTLGDSGQYATNPASNYEVNDYNYTVNNYYSAPQSANDQTTQPASSPATVQQPVASVVQPYDQVLADIQQAWLTKDVSLLRKHLPAEGVKINVVVDGKSAYSVDADKFAQMSQEAFNNLSTYGFILTYVQTSGDGSVTGYITQTYAPANAVQGSRDTVYLAFTLTNISGSWVISGINSSITPIAPPSSSASTTSNGDNIYVSK